MPRRARWLAQDDAQGLVEYAVILALTSLGMILALMLLRDSIGSPVQGSSNQLDGLTAERLPLIPQSLGGAGDPGDGSRAEVGTAGPPTATARATTARVTATAAPTATWDDQHGDR